MICVTQMQLNVIVLQLIVHVIFLCKCLQINGMPTLIFIHPLMEEVCCVHCNLLRVKTH